MPVRIPVEICLTFSEVWQNENHLNFPIFDEYHRGSHAKFAAVFIFPCADIMFLLGGAKQTNKKLLLYKTFKLAQ